MRNDSSTLRFSSAFRALPPTGAIEWEELPSLAGRIRAAAGPAQPGLPWDATRPAEFDPTPPSQPFREPFSGAVVREVTEPDIFRHFFGT